MTKYYDNNKKIKQSKYHKHLKKWYKDYNNNIMRKFINILSPYIKPFIGAFYSIIHFVFMIFSGLCLCLTNNLTHLAIILLIMALDMLFILTVHECPLTILEKKYLDTSIIHKIKKDLIKNGINYKCNHIYESQLECVMTMCGIVSTKIFTLIFIDTIKNIF
jgi:hypothetical protein